MLADCIVASEYFTRSRITDDALGTCTVKTASAIATKGN